MDTPEEKDLSISVLSSTSYDLLESNSLTEVIPIDGLSSKSVNLVDSYESKVPELGFTSSEASAESIRQIDNSTEDSTNLGSSSSTKLDGSCFVTDCNELSSVSYEAGQLGSSKETLDNVSCRWEKPLVVALKHSEGIKHKVLFQEQEAYNNTKALIHALSIYI
nr:uncharacterized protein LOC118062570 [Populus alba]